MRLGWFWYTHARLEEPQAVGGLSTGGNSDTIKRVWTVCSIYLLYFVGYLVGGLHWGALALLFRQQKHLVEPEDVEDIEQEVQGQSDAGEEPADFSPGGEHVCGDKSDGVESPDYAHREKGDEQQDSVDDDDFLAGLAGGHAGSEPVDIDKWRAELEDQEAWNPGQAEGSEGATEHEEGSERVEEKACPEQV